MSSKPEETTKEEVASHEDVAKEETTAEEVASHEDVAKEETTTEEVASHEDVAKEETTTEKVASKEDVAKEEIKNIEDSGKADVDDGKAPTESIVDIPEPLLTDAEGNEFDNLEKIPRIPAQQLIILEGYTGKNYNVITSDGYVLNILRIPFGRDRQSNGKVIYLQHGLMGSCTDWILFGKKRGLAYILADKGFDVWLGNNRGNIYSRKHKTLKPDKDNKFWDFSWHEIGKIDIPETIDFILATTGKRKLYHVGYSEGTTSFYVMTSLKPDYNDKIIHHISLAPMCFMNNAYSPMIEFLSFDTVPIQSTLETLGLHEFRPTDSLLTYLARSGSSEKMRDIMLENVLFGVCGFNPKQINASDLPLILSHYPAGAASKQFLHYGQVYRTSKFKLFDYGLARNSCYYDTLLPQSYHLPGITVPMTIIYSKNDWLSSPKDVERLSKEVKNVKEMYLVPDPLWSHLDYIFGNDAPNIVYNKVVDVLMNN